MKRYTREGLDDFLRQGLQEFSCPQKVLAVGVAGPVEDLVRKELQNSFNNCQLVTLDINPLHHPDVVADVCALPFADNHFDAVCLIEVLEHIPEPFTAVSEIGRVLKPQGVLLFSVPFIFPMHDKPHDYFRFTVFGLQHLLKNFKVVKISPKSNFVQTLSILILRLFMEKSLIDKIIAVGYLLMAPGIHFIFKHLIKSESITSGYLVWAQK